MIVGSMFMLGKGVVVYANYFGKAATVCFILSLILSFFHQELASWGVQLDVMLMWLSVALSIVAMGVYTFRAWRQVRKAEKMK